MKGLVLYFLTFNMCVNCVEWIKLSPMKKDFTATENILSYFTEDSNYNTESFVKLTDPKFSTKYENVTFTTPRPIMLSIENIKYSNMTILHTESIAHIKTNKEVEIVTKTPTIEFNEKQTKQRQAGYENSFTNSSTGKITLDILKSLQRKVFSKIPAIFEDKTKYLQNMHDNILICIDNTISKLWPNDNKRKRRGIKNDHHLDFPSAETALMTISFLTFAVYLIKLVLQVINILKNKKAMMYTPMVTGTGREFVSQLNSYLSNTSI